jgi:hypothetical protein
MRMTYQTLPARSLSAMETSRLNPKAVRNYEVCVHGTEDITSMLIYVVWWRNDILFPHVGAPLATPCTDRR